MPKKKILIIEDDLIIAKAYQNKFAKNYQLSIVNTGQDGLKQIADFVPDLIILDLMLPGGINGFDVLKELKRKDETSGIPVIVMTNLSHEEETALEEGAEKCFVKAETSLEDIEEAMNKLLTNKK